MCSRQRLREGSPCYPGAQGALRGSISDKERLTVCAKKHRLPAFSCLRNKGIESPAAANSLVSGTPLSLSLVLFPLTGSAFQETRFSADLNQSVLFGISPFVENHNPFLEITPSVSGFLHYFESIGSGDAFRRMCILDVLILNTDRHSGNFGVLYQNDTMQVQKMAPVFDNNRRLLFDLDDDQLKNAEWCIRHCFPRLGVDFVATARGLMTDAIRSDLENLRDFHFEQHPNIPSPQERLDRLTEIVQRQLEKILL